MGFSFDIRTVLMFGAVNTAICCVTLFMSRSLHSRSAAALTWGAAMHLFATVGLTLFAFRGAIDPWWSIGLANVAMISAWYCNFQAFRSLCEVDSARLAPLVIAVAGAVAFLSIGVTPEQGAVRVALGSAMQMVMAVGVLTMLAVKRHEESASVSHWAWGLHVAFVVLVAPRLAAGLGLVDPTGGFDLMNPNLFTVGNSILVVAGPMIQAMILLGWTNSRLARELRRQAATDELTRLHSRRSFFELVQRRLAEIDGHERAHALFMMDLDHFKQINDQHGHQVGDQMLVHFGQLLQRSLAPGDVAGRYGGEEFCAYVVRDDRGQIEALAEQLCARLRHSAPVVGNTPIALTVSIGVAHVCENRSLDALLSTADRYVYVAKAAGRDRWVDHEITLRNRAFTAPRATAVAPGTASPVV